MGVVVVYAALPTLRERGNFPQVSRLPGPHARRKRAIPVAQTPTGGGVASSPRRIASRHLLGASDVVRRGASPRCVHRCCPRLCHSSDSECVQVSKPELFVLGLGCGFVLEFTVVMLAEWWNEHRYEEAE